MKKIIILQTSGNELANQLWNYASIIAYAKEKGYSLENPAFFEYGNYFPQVKAGRLFKFFFFLPFTNYTKRKTALRRKIWRKLYFWYVALAHNLHKNAFFIYKSPQYLPLYLPPTKASPEILHDLEKKNGDIYFDGWLFRNPVGLEKYREEIQEYCKPRKDIQSLVSSHIKEWRAQYKKLVGVHIRQGDYRTWMNGALLIDQTRVYEIINEYLSFSGQNKSDVLFIIASDGTINEEIFSGLCFAISKNNAIADLFLLSQTDIIIGSDSTFGSFASYYGNIPHLIMQKTPLDWNYYRDKKHYFENKYCTVVHY